MGVVNFTLRPLYPGERAPGTHWIGGWVGPRAVLYAVVKRKIPSPRRESNTGLSGIITKLRENLHVIDTGISLLRYLASRLSTDNRNSELDKCSLRISLLALCGEKPVCFTSDLILLHDFLILGVNVGYRMIWREVSFVCHIIASD
jgi:hypothetical protein